MGSWRERVKGSGSYELTAYQGYGGDGKKLPRKTKTIRPPESISGKRLNKLLDTEAEKFQQEVDSGAYLDGGKLTFEEFSERWMKDYAEKQLQPKTIARYRDFLIRINQALGHIRLERLQAHHLNEFYTNLSESGVRRDGKYTLKPQYIEAVSADKNKMAEKAGANPRTIAKLISGSKTTFEVAEKIAAVLKVSANKAFQAEEKATGLNPKTIVEHHRLIHAILNRAEKWQIVTGNIADRAEPPKVVRTEAAHYDEEQVMRLLEVIQNEPLKHQVAVYLGAFGGLRAGEMTGLEWPDIDFDNNCISINRTRQYLPGMDSFDKVPKTERSKRTIEMSIVAMKILRRHREEQEEISLKLGNKWTDSGKVLTQLDGKPMSPQTPSAWFGKFLKRNGLPHLTLHQLRHTHISLLLANDVDIATISKRAGHSKISTTLDVYSHSIRNRDRVAADKLDDMVKLKGNQRLQEDSEKS